MLLFIYFIHVRTLTSLNLPAVLEDLSDRQRVPQSLIEKAQQIKDMGGIRFLSIHMTELSELLQRNREILNEVHAYTTCKDCTMQNEHTIMLLVKHICVRCIIHDRLSFVIKK